MAQHITIEEGLTRILRQPTSPCEETQYAYADKLATENLLAKVQFERRHEETVNMYQRHIERSRRII